MPEILFPNFHDEWIESNYPFGDDLSLTSVDGFTIPQRLFRDAAIYPSGLGAGGRISSINVDSLGVTIVIGDAKTLNLATAFFTASELPSALAVVDDYGRPSGTLVVDPVLSAALTAWPAGNHGFLVGKAEFVTSCCIPTPSGVVEALRANSTELLTGEVWLVGDQGVIVRYIDDEIRVDVVGDPLFVRRTCEPVNQFATPNFIKTINGHLPDILGNFNLTVGTSISPDTIVRIYPKDGGLHIEAAGPLLQG